MTFKFTSIYLDNPINYGRVIDIFEPEEVTQDIALFFVHGGGWGAGTRTCYHTIMRGFNEQGFICASTDYRLGSDNVKILDQITDIRHAYDEFVCYLKTKKRPLKIFVSGCSAGAHLAELLAFARPGECGENLNYKGRKLENEWVKPVGVSVQAAPVTFEPWEDIFPVIWTAMKWIAGVSYEQNPELYRRISPITYLRPDICPVFQLAAENEHMFPIQQAEDFVKQIQALGINARFKVYTNAEHGFFYDLTRRQQKEAFADILEFIASIK